jgi:anti-sigma B factor antagonist
MGTPHRRLDAQEIGDVTVVRFVDRKLMKDRVDEVAVELFKLADDPRRRKLLVDLANLEYLSSAALGKFISLGKKVQRHGGRLLLCNVHESIRELFKVTKLDHLLEIHAWNPDDDPDAQLGGAWIA